MDISDTCHTCHDCYDVMMMYYKERYMQNNKPLGSHVEPGRLVIPRLEAGALDMGTGRAGTRVSRLRPTGQGQFMLGWSSGTGLPTL